MGTVEQTAAKRFVDALWKDEEGLVKAAVADGWPEAMVRAGLVRHRKTWDVDAMARSLTAELEAVSSSGVQRLLWPDEVHHIWPALPGAGLSPVLVGMLLGLEQVVHSSSRGVEFARRLAQAAPWELIEGDDAWRGARLVVVSGSDDTVASVRQVVEPRGRVVGYGHRVSLAVVVDGKGGTLDLAKEADAIASDVVMWHQKGCFSVRAVLFCGSAPRREAFAEELAAAIARRERQWDALEIGDAELAQRAQALGVAEMRGDVFCDGLGYVRLADDAFDGSREATHSVTVHAVEGPEAVDEVLALPVGHVQGVSLSTPSDGGRNRWIDALSQAGATRICEAGSLQTPPAAWWHDGRPNALSWARVVTLR